MSLNFQSKRARYCRLASGVLLSVGLSASMVFAPALRAQEDGVDEIEAGDETATALRALDRRQLTLLRQASLKVLESVSVRLRLTQVEPNGGSYFLKWREGGEGLTKEVRRGQFLPPGKAPKKEGEVAVADASDGMALNQWSGPVSLQSLLDASSNWSFLNVTVEQVGAVRGKRLLSEAVKSAVLEMELADADGKAFRTLSEAAPNGATITFAVPTQLVMVGLLQQGYLAAGKKAVAPRYEAGQFNDFAQGVTGLLGYVQARRKRLEAKYSVKDTLPQKYGVVGRVAGYGVSGYGLRHSNPAIIREEAETLRLMGFNGLTGGSGKSDLTESALPPKYFDRIYWGAPGAGSPMGYFSRRENREKIPSPLDPELKKAMQQTVAAAIIEHAAHPAQEKWGLWWDEIGVVLKGGIESTPGGSADFQKYLQGLGVKPADVGAKSWNEVSLFALWPKDEKGKPRLASRPDSITERLLYYYTYRYMTYATGRLFTSEAAELQKAGVLLYSMQGPIPSWSGYSLDWHEFYDQDPNRVLVFETSNRDPRIWQWESYLNDIMRGIAERHKWPQGVLLKPHRGAPKQRMLTSLANGVRSFEWYTFGPDYVKGDSFSSKSNLIDAVAEANRFAGRAEEYLYEAKHARPAEVAFVASRSSHIWEAAGKDKSVSEDAKWVYMALRHANIPVDILSEQQLIEGKLDAYKVLYFIGPNLHRDAAAKVRAWVSGGGVLWTDAMGLSRNEADEPAPAMSEILGLGERRLEKWGSVAGYLASVLDPIVEENVPDNAAITSDGQAGSTLRAVIAREPLDVNGTAGIKVIGKFKDGRAAIVRHAFGKGAAYVVGTYAGLAYSAKVRRPDFDMSADYDAALRDWIVAPALAANVYRPVVTSQPTVETVLLEKNGQRSVAVMNWTYTPAKAFVPLKNVRVGLPGVGAFKSVRSLKSGALKIEGEGANRSVVLANLDEIDLLVLD